MIDLFGIHIAPDASRKLLKRLRRLQDILGDHQDFEVHGDLFEDLAQGSDAEFPTEARPCAHALALRLYARQTASRQRFAEAFARFARGRVRKQVGEAFQSVWPEE